MRTGCLIVDGCQRLHENSAELLLLTHLAEGIAPQSRLRFERELLGDGVVQVSLLAIDKCRKPIILACVDSPAVKMEIVVRFCRTCKGTVESHRDNRGPPPRGGPQIVLCPTFPEGLRQKPGSVLHPGIRVAR